MDVSVQVIN